MDSGYELSKVEALYVLVLNDWARAQRRQARLARFALMLNMVCVLAVSVTLIYWLVRFYG